MEKMKKRRFGGVMMDPLRIERRGDNLGRLDFRSAIDLSLDQRELLGKWEFQELKLSVLDFAQTVMRLKKHA